MGKLDDAERVHAETAAEWRVWLEASADRGEGVWLVSWKKATTRFKRVVETAEKAARGERANQWPRKA